MQLKRPMFGNTKRPRAMASISRFKVSCANVERLDDGDGNVGETRTGTYDNAEIRYSSDAVKLVFED